MPPELDALCAAMLAMEPSRRPTARACADRLTAFLDATAPACNDDSVQLELQDATLLTVRGMGAEARRAR